MGRRNITNSMSQSRNRITLHHTATHCNTLQHAATHIASSMSQSLSRITLHHTATHCNTLQQTATHIASSMSGSLSRITLHHTATHCNTLQHAATHIASAMSGSTSQIHSEEGGLYPLIESSKCHELTESWNITNSLRPIPTPPNNPSPDHKDMYIYFTAHTLTHTPTHIPTPPSGDTHRIVAVQQKNQNMCYTHIHKYTHTHV